MDTARASSSNKDLRRKIVIGYYALVAFLGIWTMIKFGGDLEAIFMSLKAEGNHQLNPFTQSYIYNFIFKNLALWGSMVIIYLLLTNKKYNKAMIVVYQLVLIISFIMYFVELFYGMIRPYFPDATNIYATVGVSQILDHMLSYNSAAIRIVFLLCGVFISSFVLKKYESSNSSL